MKYKLAKCIRIFTIAPVMSLTLLLIMYFLRLPFIGGLSYLLTAIFFLSVVPVLGYPLQPLLPRFRAAGREGQRNLAIIMAFLGYAGGVVAGLVMSAPQELLIVFLTYLLTDVLIILFNTRLHLRASGHAASVAGPIAASVYLLGVDFLWGILIFAATCWASLTMKRHTWIELLIGMLLPLASLAISIVVSGWLC